MESRTQTKLNTWPSPQDYNEAIQNLAANTTDTQLREGRVQLTELGLPRPLTGAFASVYRVECADAVVAVRCFLRDLRDQEARYEHIANFVRNDSLPYTVTFDFLRQGIRVGATWFPALKMDWVAGPNLDQFISEHLDSAQTLNQLALDFRRMCIELGEAGIAHGDLQHGNIIVANEGIRLVDYDGMFVPEMSGMASNEIGHRNYQHPARGANHFDASLDNFSAWVIYTSLACVARDSNLWHKLSAGDDCLLFRRDDFVEPEYSFAFNVLENHFLPEIRDLAQHLRRLCHQRVDEVPPLTHAPLAVPSALPPLCAPKAAPKILPAAKTPVPSLSTTSLPPTATTIAIAAVESELNQPLPRWIRRSDEWWKTGSPLDEWLVANGTPTRSTHFSIDVSYDALAESGFYTANYQFLVGGKVMKCQKRLIQRTSLTGVRELTILYNPNCPSENAIYAILPIRAVPVTVPADLEPELLKRQRNCLQRSHIPYRYYLKAALTGAVFLLLFSIMYAGTGQLNLWLLLFALTVPWWVAGRADAHNAKLTAAGVPARARVMHVRNVDGEAVEIAYQFKPYDSTLVQSNVTTNDTSLMGVDVGDKITVLYDIDKPKSHIVYKHSSYEVA